MAGGWHEGGRGGGSREREGVMGVGWGSGAASCDRAFFYLVYFYLLVYLFVVFIIYFFVDFYLFVLFCLFIIIYIYLFYLIVCFLFFFFFINFARV